MKPESRLRGGIESPEKSRRVVLTALDCGCGRPGFLTKELFPEGCHELCLDHNGEKYTLRITKQNKLILNK